MSDEPVPNPSGSSYLQSKAVGKGSMTEFVTANANPGLLGGAEEVGEEEKERVILGKRYGEPEEQAGEKEECDEKEEHESEGGSIYEMTEDKGKEGRNVKHVHWEDKKIIRGCEHNMANTWFTSSIL